MEGKFTKLEKNLLGMAFYCIVLATIQRVFMGVEDVGVLVIMAFTAALVYVILLVAALFPADWRMTEKQKSKIADKEKYQATYRRVLVWVNLVAGIFFALLIHFAC